MARCRINNKDINTSKDLMQELRNLGLMDNNDIIDTSSKVLELEELIRQKDLEDVLEIIEVVDNNGNVYKTVNLKTSFNYNAATFNKDTKIEIRSLKDYTNRVLNSFYEQKNQLKVLLYSKGENITQKEFNDINFALKKIDLQIEDTKKFIEDYKSEIVDKEDGEELYKSFLSKSYRILEDIISSKNVRAEELLSAKNMLKAIVDLKENIYDKMGSNVNDSEFLQELFKALPGIEKNLKERIIDFTRENQMLSSDKKALEIFDDQIDNGLDDINFMDKWFYDPSITLSGNESIIEAILHRHVVDQISELETQGAALNDKLAKADKRLSNYIKNTPSLERLLNKAMKIGGSFSVNYRNFLTTDPVTNKKNSLIKKYTSQWFKRKEAVDAIYNKYMKEGNIKEAARLLRDFLHNDRSDAIVIDYSKINDPDYFKEIASHIGEHQTKKEFKKAEKLYKQYELSKNFFIQENNHHRGVNSLVGNIEVQKWINANDPSLVQNFLDGNSEISTLEFSVIIPRKTNTKYFDAQYAKLEQHSEIVEYIDILQEHQDFKTSHDPDWQNKFEDTVPIIKQNFREKFVELISKREVLKALKLFYSEVTSDIYSDLDTTLKTKKFPTNSKAWERFKNGLFLLASRKIDAISPIKTHHSYQVAKTFLSSNKTEIEAKAVQLKVLYGLKGANFTVNKKKFGDDILVSRAVGGTTNLFSRLFDIVKDQGLTEKEFETYIKNNYKTGTFNLNKFLENIVVNEMIQENSFNLTEAFALQTQNTARYAGSRLAMPVGILLKELNDSLSSEKVDSRGVKKKVKSTSDLESGARENAFQRSKEWFSRVVGLEDTRQVWGANDTISYENLDEVKSVIDTIDSTSNISVKDLEKLQKFVRQNSNKMVMGDWLFLLARMTRFMSLSFSPISAARNLIEGEMTINVMTEVFAGYGLINAQDVRDNDKTKIYLERLTYAAGKASPDNLYAKLHYFTKTHRLLQDAQNNLQRALQTSSEGREAVTNSNIFQPYGMLQATESYNQYPFIAALMKNVKLTGKDGVESDLLNAIEYYSIKDSFGKTIEEGIKLKDNFNTDEYKNEFISPDGSPRSQAYKDFAYKATDMIKYTNGDFDELSGNMAKSNPIGNVMSVFRSWWPQHLLQKFKGASYNITQGNVREGQVWGGKNAATWGLLGFTAMLPIYGFPMALAVGLGATLGSFTGSKPRSIGYFKDLKVIVELGAKNTINTLPIVSKLLGKVLGKDQLLQTDKIDLLGGVTVEELYKDHTDGTNNATPAAIKGLGMLLANTAKMGMLMALSSLLLYDDDDEEDDTRRMAYNLASNNATTFYNQSFEMLNLVYQFETMMKAPSSSFLGNVGKVFQNMGTEINPTTGEYKFFESLKRLPPGMFGYFLGDGEASANRKFKVTYLDYKMRWLANEDSKEIKKEIRAERKMLRMDLESQGVYSEKEVEEIVNEQIPTYSMMVEEGIITPD